MHHVSPGMDLTTQYLRDSCSKDANIIREVRGFEGHVMQDLALLMKIIVTSILLSKSGANFRRRDIFMIPSLIAATDLSIFVLHVGNSKSKVAIQQDIEAVMVAPQCGHPS